MTVNINQLTFKTIIGILPLEREKKQKDDPSLERHARMRISMEDTWRNRRSRETRKSNIRVAIIVAILVGIILIIKQKLGL